VRNNKALLTNWNVKLEYWREELLHRRNGKMIISVPLAIRAKKLMQRATKERGCQNVERKCRSMIFLWYNSFLSMKL
jgi:hypothetical protein